ncbi:MBL fold metallo-hydrolase [Dermabacteraceae bacterium P13115]
MRAHLLTSPLFAANCTILLDEESKQAIVVDPGLDVADRVKEFLRENEATLTGILLTHGHLDHVADVSRLAPTSDVPVYIGAGDEYRLEEPSKQLPMAFIAPIQQQWLRHGWQRPSRIERVTDGDTVRLGEYEIRAISAPGHTEGSTLWLCDFAVCFSGETSVSVPAVLFTGDVLFAGSVGRTDLLGGNQETMQESLTVFAEMPINLTVLPGHGPLTTVGAERQSNPYLRAALA